MDKLRLGIPKGSLEKATIELFRRSGWHIQVNGRSYFPDIDDPEIACSMCRAQEMSRYVADGTLDCGLTGLDWTMENDSQVEVVADLMYSKSSQNPVRWVVAVPADSEIRSLRDLAGKKIATELVNYTRRYFAQRQIPVGVEFSWGATEATCTFLPVMATQSSSPTIAAPTTTAKNSAWKLSVTTSGRASTTS